MSAMPMLGCESDSTEDVMIGLELVCAMGEV